MCLLLVIINYLLLLYSLTSSALPSHSQLALTSLFRLFPLTGERGLFSDLLFWWVAFFVHSYLFSFPFCLHPDFHSDFLHFMSSFCPFPPSPSVLSLSLHLMPLFRTLLPLHSACWNTRWRRGAGVAAVVNAQLGEGVLEVEVGAVLTSNQQQWWWSCARCSLAPLVLYEPPSPPPSSLGPGRKKMRVLHVWPTWSDILEVVYRNVLQCLQSHSISKTKPYLTFTQNTYYSM